MTADRKSEIEVTAMDLRRDFGEIVDAVIGGRPHIVTRHGRPVAVMISVDDYNDFKAMKGQKSE